MDLVDIWMAVSSWAELFWEPSWWNAWWAVLDTVALLPLIPSLRGLKSTPIILEKIKTYAKSSKANFEKVLSKFKTWREYIQKLFKNRLFPKLVYFWNIKINRSQLERKFKHMSEMWLTSIKSLEGLKKHERIPLLKKYQDEIIKILQNSNEIYESKVWDTLTYTFLYKNKLVHLKRNNFEFLSWYNLTKEKHLNLKMNDVLVKKTWNIWVTGDIIK